MTQTVLAKPVPQTKIMEYLKRFFRSADPLRLHLERVLPDQLYLLIMTSIAIPLMALACYAVYSGAALEFFVRILVQACLQSGTCNDPAAVLTGAAGGLFILFVISLMLFRATRIPDTTLVVDAASMTNLLINWYRIGARERAALLSILESTDVEVPFELINNLRLEHKEMERIDGNSSAAE